MNLQFSFKVNDCYSDSSFGLENISQVFSRIGMNQRQEAIGLASKYQLTSKDEAEIESNCLFIKQFCWNMTCAEKNGSLFFSCPIPKVACSVFDKNKPEDFIKLAFTLNTQACTKLKSQSHRFPNSSAVMDSLDYQEEIDNIVFQEIMTSLSIN